MTKVSERERIAALEAKLKQLKVVQQRKEARARTVEARRTRREEMRRKFLVGAVVLAKVEAGEIEEETLKQWLDPAVTKPEDRALFELDAGIRSPRMDNAP
jgi:hypothetical protein